MLARLFVSLLLLCLVGCTEIYASPDDIYDPTNCTGICGTESCPCIGLASAIDAGYTFYTNGTTNITILVLPGSYVGAKNSQLNVNYTLTIKSQNGSNDTFFGDAYFLVPIFIVESATLTIQGFQIHQARAFINTTLIGKVTNGELIISDLVLADVWAQLLSLDSSSLTISDSKFSLCAHLEWLFTYSNNVTITFQNVHFEDCSGPYLLYDANQSGSVNIVNCTITGNDFTVMVSTNEITLENSVFFKNFASSAFILGNIVNVTNCQFSNETFSLSYIHSNGMITTSNNHFDNVECVLRTEDDLQGTVLLLSSNSYDIKSTITDTYANNCTSYQFFYLKNCTVDVINFDGKNITGAVARVSIDDLSSDISLREFSIDYGNEANIIILIYTDTTANIPSLVTIADFTFTNYIGSSYPIDANNRGGYIEISNLNLYNSERAIVSTGQISVVNMTYINGSSPIYSPLLFKEGTDVTLQNIFLDNIVAETAAVIYFSRENITIDQFFVTNSIASQSSIFNIETSTIHFTNLICTNSTGDTGGAILLNEGFTHIFNGYFANNRGRLGGSIYVKFGEIHMFGTTIERNRAEYGGGVYLQEATIDWNNSSCIDNISYQDGGCLFTRNIVNGNITSVIFSNNSCLGAGGGITLRNLNQVNFKSCLVSENIGLNGGGLYISGSSLSSFADGTITNNHAISSGGGIFIKEQAQPKITNTTVSYNHADSTGGGIKIADNSTPILQSLLVDGNESPNEGGGISYTDSSSGELSDSIISNNFVNASGGGIVFSISSHTLLNNVIIRNNSAKSKGGGIAFYNQCSPKLVNVTFSNNLSPEGAGVSCRDSATPTFENSTFENNTASSGGASITYDYATASYIHCIFKDNHAGIGGAVVVSDFAPGTFTNCEFIRNSADRGGGMFLSSQHETKIDACEFRFNVASEGAAILGTDQSFIHILNGNCTGNIANVRGGCMFLESESSVTCTAMTFTENIINATVGIGGALSVADRSSLHLESTTFQGNFAPVGGAMYVDQFALLNGNLVTIHSNSALFEGGGIYSEGNLMSLANSQFYNNTCRGRGGGLAVTSFDLIDAPITLCENCLFSYNTATHGGGAFVSIRTEAIIPQPENMAGVNQYCETENIIQVGELRDDNFFLQNVGFIGNSADRGGGIYYDHPSATVGIVNGTFNLNKAAEFGGAIFVLRDRSIDNSDQWLVQSTFVNNGAYFGGSNVGWSIADSCPNDNFYVNCVFGHPVSTFDGYEDARGFASPPYSIQFVEACPPDVTLSDDPFDVTLQLVDKFSTPVTGHFVQQDITVSVAVVGNCTFDSTTANSTTIKVSLAGEVSFQGIQLQGYDNQTCSLEFYISSNISRYISNQTCDIVFNGCAKNELISSIPGNYDTCIENVSQQQRVNQVLFLIFIIILLLAFILLGGCATILWERLVVTKPKPFVFSPPVEDKEITMDDLLNDPGVCNIPWQDITLGNRIGHGATGLVLSGTWQKDVTTSIDIALKEINFGSNPENHGNLISMMLTEIRLMCALDDPHILKLYGISLSDTQQLYLVMELMHQGSLRDLLDKKGNNLSWQMRLKFAISAAKGIAYLHNYKIIHRDIKPQNILVNREWKCKVADFGISTTNDNSKNTVIGTPVYMAPEIFNENNYTEKVDVYAFSILLVELYTSQRPYSSPEHDELPQTQLLLQICNNNLRPDTTGIPATLKQLLEDCWNQSPKMRPSFKEIIVRLRRLKTLELPGTEPRAPTLRSRWISIDASAYLSSEEEDDEDKLWVEPTK